MSNWPAPSALDAATQIFPTLTPAQIARLRPAGQVRKVEPGEILFKPGDTEVPFFVLLSGAMEIVQPGMDGAAERPITPHAAGEFTGEISMISGQRCLVRRRAERNSNACLYPSPPRAD
jgi:thioredoxin reductase (NADPH)